MGCLEGQGCLWLWGATHGCREVGGALACWHTLGNLQGASLFLLWLQVDRRLEGWIWKLAEELKTQLPHTNVIIADWLSLAHAHYPIAVQNTRDIGQEIARFLEWLEVSRERRSSQAGCSREPPSGKGHPYRGANCSAFSAELPLAWGDCVVTTRVAQMDQHGPSRFLPGGLDSCGCRAGHYFALVFHSWLFSRNPCSFTGAMLTWWGTAWGPT